MADTRVPDEKIEELLAVVNGVIANLLPDSQLHIEATAWFLILLELRERRELERALIAAQFGESDPNARNSALGTHAQKEGE